MERNYASQLFTFTGLALFFLVRRAVENAPICDVADKWERWEHFARCGRQCELNCTTLNDPEANVFQCLKDCKEQDYSCGCTAGAVRQPNGKCGIAEHCPRELLPQCRANADLKFCGESIYCSLRCSDLLRNETDEEYWNRCPPSGCMVMPPICICDRGFYYREADGECVRQANCTQTNTTSSST